MQRPLCYWDGVEAARMVIGEVPAHTNAAMIDVSVAIQPLEKPIMPKYELAYEWRLSDPDDCCYMTDIDSWIEAHHLTDVCVFSYQDKSLQPYSIGDTTLGPRCK
jgi:hypothetical protein